jgi:hypothetical protein
MKGLRKRIVLLVVLPLFKPQHRRRTKSEVAQPTPNSKIDQDDVPKNDEHLHQWNVLSVSSSEFMPPIIAKEDGVLTCRTGITLVSYYSDLFIFPSDITFHEGAPDSKIFAEMKDSDADAESDSDEALKQVM